MRAVSERATVPGVARPLTRANHHTNLALPATRGVRPASTNNLSRAPDLVGIRSCAKLAFGAYSDARLATRSRKPWVRPSTSSRSSAGSIDSRPSMMLSSRRANSRHEW